MQFVQHDACSVLAAAHLGVQRRRLPIGEPGAARVAACLGLEPEQQCVDAAIKPLRSRITGTLIRNRPRPYPRWGSGFDCRDDAVGDILIKIFHGFSKRKVPVEVR
jgi:hypothetical protein